MVASSSPSLQDCVQSAWAAQSFPHLQLSVGLSATWTDGWPVTIDSSL